MGQRHVSNEPARFFCEGSTETCEDCVGSCGIEEYEELVEPILKALRPHSCTRRYGCVTCREAEAVLTTLAREVVREHDGVHEMAHAFIGHKGLGDEFTAWLLARRAEVDALLSPPQPQ